MTQSRLPADDQTWLIRYMQHLGYRSRPDGVCFGHAYMAVQAMLLNDMRTFDERFAKMRRLAEQADVVVKASMNLLKLSEADAIEQSRDEVRAAAGLDVLAFLDGVEVRSQPGSFARLLGTPVHLTQSSGLWCTLPFLLPSQLDAEAENPQDRVLEVSSFSGSYSFEELKSHFGMLAHVAGKMAPSPKHPVVMAITSGFHTLSVGYDISTGKWIYADVKKSQTMYFDDVEEMARAVYTAFGSSPYTVFSTKCYATNTEAKSMAALVSSWRGGDYGKHINPIKKDTDRFGNSVLHIAAFRGDLKEVEQALALGVDANAMDSFGYPPLYLAASTGRVDIVRALLKAGARINDRERSTEATALVIAAQSGHDEVVKELLAAGAALGFMRKDGQTALSLAQKYDRQNIVTQLSDVIKKNSLPSSRPLSDIFPASVVKKAPGSKPAVREKNTPK